MAKYLDLRNKSDYQELKEASEVIKNKGLVLFPTETVYGIGANGLDEEACLKIFKAKGRKTDNPLILHVSNMEMVESIAENISELEQKLMETFWPGPFTIILKKKKIVPNVVTGNMDTVAIRMPSHPIANKLIEYANLPIAAPSANISGKPSGTRIEDIFNELNDKVDYIIDDGESTIGVESTVVRVIDGVVHILRPGKITKDDLLKVTDKVEVDSHVLGKLEEGTKVLSPGMKYKHYAPDSKCVLVYSDNHQKLISKMQEIASEYKKPLVLTRTSNMKYFKGDTLDLGESLEDISKNIFKELRQVDKYEPDIVIIEGVSKEGLGLAIMNRLIRACSHNYIEI